MVSSPKHPAPDKMIKESSEVEFTLGTVREVLHKREDLPMNSRISKARKYKM